MACDGWAKCRADLGFNPEAVLEYYFTTSRSLSLLAKIFHCTSKHSFDTKPIPSILLCWFTLSLYTFNLFFE